MYEPLHIITDKLRWLIIGTLTVLATLLATSLLVPITESNAQAQTSDSRPRVRSSTYDSPNAVTSGLVTATNELQQNLVSTERALSSAAQSTLNTVSTAGSFVGRNLYGAGSFIGRGLQTSAAFVGKGIANSALFMARTTTSSVLFVINLPGAILGRVADTALISSVIKPASNTPVPVISSGLPAVIAAPAAAAAPTATPQSQPDTSAAWPIRGDITTLFGVPHWPYQPVHTGMDISDGQRSGVTPIKPFKPGTVVDIVHSNSGLGNSVTVDHGGGLTSVYAHLASISVQIGQNIDKTTTLGTEGSTGASTGTHLHFEIRVNGQAVDPRQYITGQP